MIKIGTDCSGIEAPIEALKKICDTYGLSFEHVFSSEIDKYALKYIRDNHTPKIIFGDMTKRDINDVPDIDLYISGFPCQPFSRANKFKTDVDPRLNLFNNCLDVIINKKPKIFILENVKTLVTLNDGKYFQEILSILKNLDIYDVYWKVVNSKDYGIPHCRDRLYIIGIQKNLSKYNFEFPKKKQMRDIKEFIDLNDNTIMVKKECNYELFNNIPNDSVFIDIGFRKAKFPNSNKWAPCITAQPNMWCVPKNRKANIKEYLSLQGFPTEGFVQNISDHQFKKKIGNSMTVDVIEELLIQCFKNINII
jgi:DNA (cytosine-5)-methyltransferase 1